MMRQPALVRDRIIRHLHELRVQLQQLPEVEHEALAALGGVPYQDLDQLTATVNLLMQRLGHDTGTPKEPRFDKTRRALAKKTPKGPRGVTKRRGFLTDDVGTTYVNEDQ